MVFLQAGDHRAKGLEQNLIARPRVPLEAGKFGGQTIRRNASRLQVVVQQREEPRRIHIKSLNIHARDPAIESRLRLRRCQQGRGEQIHLLRRNHGALPACPLRRSNASFSVRT